MTQTNWDPLIGVVVGFALGQMATVVSWLVSERRQKKLTRTLASLEIDQNLGLLRDYWNNVSLPPDEDAPPEESNEVEADRLARRAVELPLPVLSEKALNAQLSTFPKVLSEREIRDTWHFYEEIAQIQSIQGWLVAVSAGPVTEKDRFPSASRAIRSEGLRSATFKTRGAGAIFDLRQTIQNLLTRGNPLASKG